MKPFLRTVLADMQADIKFGVSGNALEHQLTGWSHPEDGFTWSSGQCSVLRLPQSPPGQDFLLILEGDPFLSPPNLRFQRVRISHGGRELTRFRVETRFVKAVRLSGSLSTAASSSIEIDYPDCATPMKFGSLDLRMLAIAWRRIRVIKVPAAKLSQEKEPAPGRRSDSKTGSRDRSLDIKHPSSGEVAQELDLLLVHGLRTGDPKPAARVIGSAHEMPGISLVFDQTLPDDFSVVRCAMESNGLWAFGFSAAWRSIGTDNPAARMVAWHLLATLPIFAAYSDQALLPGSFLLSLGDEAHARGVAFCANNDTALLIPDPYFMRSMGYKTTKSLFASGLPPFTNRTRAALWRGSTTGYREAAEVLQLPRVRLCLRARCADAEGVIDAGFTSFVQLMPGEEDRLRALDLVRPFIAPDRLPEWMFHIDIDGNTNSWPGLFTKLLSGGTVLKVDSERGWRQWYYDRLEPHVHFMPVAADLRDLAEKVRYLTYCTREAESLATEGRALAQSMSYEHEIVRALATIEEAVVQEALMAAEPD